MSILAPTANAIESTPEAIVDPGSHVNTGLFDKPFANVNIETAPARTIFTDTIAAPLSRLVRPLRFKRWHYISMTCERYLVAACIVDAAYLGNVFAYVVDREQNTCWEWHKTIPAALGVTISPNSLTGQSVYSARNWGSIAMINDAAAQSRTLTLDLQGDATKPSIQLICDIEEDAAVQPVVAVQTVAPNTWSYTHKCYGLPAGATLRIGNETVEIPMGKAFAGIDYTAGYRKYETFWNWAAGGGMSTDDVVVGFSLTAHTHADADTDDALDCGVWLDGRLIPIRRTRFHYDRNDLLSPWRISDDDDIIDLTFHPENQRSQHINFGLVASQFTQPYGRFTGTIRGPESGHTYTLDKVLGVTEQHFARW